jgi:phosphate transport system substrate-binding protein
VERRGNRRRKPGRGATHRHDPRSATFGWFRHHLQLHQLPVQGQTGIGEGTTVNWIGSTVGGKGNEGVASYVQQLKGSIGYVELSYALQNKMAYASMQNGAGNWIQPNAASFAAAAASADWTSAKDFSLVITNAPGAQAWPITATNFILMRKQPRDAAAAKAALDFFRWAYASGTEQAKSLDYVPLPTELVAEVEAYWAAQLK